MHSKLATYAFLDSGCGSVFADSDLCDKLKVRTRKRKLLIGTLLAEQEVNSELVLDTLQISGLEGNKFIDLPQVYLQDGLPVSTQDMPTQEDLKSWDHLSHIEVPSIPSNYYNMPKVSLMIGNSVPAATMPLKTSCGELGEPYAIYTPLGWAVYGIPGKLQGEDKVLAHFCKSHAVVKDGAEDLEQQFKSYVRMDFSKNLSDDRRMKSKEDQQFLDMASKSIEHKDGHYHLSLPLRNANVIMPNNKKAAVQRAESLRNKLGRNQDLHREYTDAMTKVIEKGSAELVPEQDNSHNGTFLIMVCGIRRRRNYESSTIVRLPTEIHRSTRNCYRGRISPIVYKVCFLDSDKNR